MNEIIIHTNELPITLSGALSIASTPFIHPDRVTDFDVLIYVTNGQITVTETEQAYEINKGEIFFLKHGLHHYGKSKIAQGTSWYYIHFYTQDNASTFQSFIFETEPGNLGLNNKPLLFSMRIPKKIAVSPDSNLAHEISEFIEYLNSKEPLRRWNINIKLFQLLSECALSEQKNIKLQNSQSDQICLFLQEHICDPFHAAILEHHFHLSYKYMATKFKNEKQLTIQQYHTNLRINMARKLLRSTKLSINEISSKLGYSDVLYFSRVFHSHAGFSPTAYRKQDAL